MRKTLNRGIAVVVAGFLTIPAGALAQTDSASGGSGAAAEDVTVVTGQRSVLSSRGTLVVEPSIQYTHSSATQVDIQGFTVIPAIAIGLINVSQVQRDTFTSALTLRYGLTQRLEVETRVPWVYREEAIREREVLAESSFPGLERSRGKGLGDVEAALRYQLNTSAEGPLFVGSLRVKSDTGTGPFDVETQSVLTDDGDRIGEIFVEQPTGSGFWSVQPSLSVIYPTQPAVLYGHVGYLWNIERDVGGDYGRVNPGDAVSVGLGMGLAVNDRTSFSLGYDHSVVDRTRIKDLEHDLQPTFRRLQVGTASLGISQRLGPRTTANLGLGFGVTEAAPDVQISLRLPMRF